MTGPFPEDAVLCMENNHQIIEIFIGEKKVYSFGKQNKGPAGWILGNIWTVADLPESLEGKTAALKITAPYTPGEWRIPEIMFGDRSSVTQMIRDDSLSIALFGVLSSVLGLCFLVAFLLLRFKRTDFNRKDFLYLGAFILLSTFWIITDSKIPQFVTEQFAPVYILSFLLFMLFPVPFMFFLRQICPHGRKVLDFLSFLFILNVLFCIGLYMAGIADLVKTLPVTHILMAVGTAVSIFVCLREQIYYRNEDTFFVLAGICALAAGGMISLLTFHPQKSGDNSLYFRGGLIVFYVFLCYGSLKRGLSLLKTSLEAETYRTMAFKDVLTGLGNRAAFDRDAESLQLKKGAGPFAVAVFDINNLKHINDTYGHTAGDQLIKDTAYVIKRAFSNLGECYRIGGDEFVVIMESISEKNIQQAFLDFNQSIRRCGEGHPGSLNVAGGCASGGNDGNAFIYKLFREADAQMYEEKQKMSHKMN